LGYNGGNLTWGNALGEANYYSGYTAEAVYVDGLSLAPTSFGEFDEDTGIWKPINVSGLTFGNNGYYLDFKDSSNLGNDAKWWYRFYPKQHHIRRPSYGHTY
jgi:hypothetical protein